MKLNCVFCNGVINKDEAKCYTCNELEAGSIVPSLKRTVELQRAKIKELEVILKGVDELSKQASLKASGKVYRKYDTMGKEYPL